MPQTKSISVSAWSLLNEWGRGVFILGHTQAQVFPMYLTTLQAPPTGILGGKQEQRERIQQTEWEGRHSIVM
jgi:hypothetical protein